MGSQSSSKHFSRQPPVLSNVDTKPLVGPIFIGVCLTWMLLGTLIVQVYWYSHRFPRDRSALKILVYSLFFTDVFQTIISTWASWELVIARWGDIGVLLVPPRSVAAVPIFSAVVGAVVQTFYAWRIWTLGGHAFQKLTSIVIVSITIVQSIACTINSIRFAAMDNTTKLPAIRAGFVIWLAGSFACDILIAASMLYILNRARGRSRSLSISMTTLPNASGGTSSQHSHVDKEGNSITITVSILDRLIRQTVETGAVTTVCAGVELVLFLCLEMQFQHIAPAYVLGKLYTNCLMASLNSRRVHDTASTSVFSESGTRLDSAAKRTKLRSGNHITVRGHNLDDALADGDLERDQFGTRPRRSAGERADRNGAIRKDGRLGIECSVQTETVVTVNGEARDRVDLRSENSITNGRISSDGESVLTGKGDCILE